LVFGDVQMILRLSVSRRITLQRSFGKRFRMVVLKVMGKAFYIPIFAKRAMFFRGKRKRISILIYILIYIVIDCSLSIEMSALMRFAAEY
jgi:hypothetical protein